MSDFAGPRGTLEQAARDTLEILERGGYAGPRGEVRFLTELRRSVAGTYTYSPEEAQGLLGDSVPVPHRENA